MTTMPRRNTPRLCFIGFGEAGQAMAAGLRAEGIAQIAAWDILFPAAEGERLRQAGAQIGVRLAASAADAVQDSDIIISAVTAASSLAAAQSVAAHLDGHPFYLDVNSVSPGRKQATAVLLRLVEQMPYDQIAAALDCSEVTARVHVQRGREELRQKLAHMQPSAGR